MLQVLRKLEGATPSQRKQFRANEKARLQDLAELEVKNLQCLRLIPDVFLYHSTTHFENDVTFLSKVGRPLFWSAVPLVRCPADFRNVSGPADWKK